MLTIPLLIDGKEVNTSKTLDVSAPATGKVVHNVACATSTEVEAAIAAAKAAYPAWSKTSPYERRDLFLKAASILGSRLEEYAQYEVEAIAATPGFAAGFDVPTSVSLLRDVAGRIVSLSGSYPQLGGDRGAIVVKEPYGVILGIAPWYFILHLIIVFFVADIMKECWLHPWFPCSRLRHRSWQYCDIQR